MKDRRALREQVKDLLRQGNFPGLVQLAGRETGVTTLLLQLLYAPDELLHWRALEGLGHLAAAYPGRVQKVIGRLLWSLNEDSGSFGWGAAAALGEIGRHQVSLIQEIIPMFIGFLEEPFSQGPMLWGLGRLGEVHPELIAEVVPDIVPFITSSEPQLRAYAAWCLGKLRYREAAPRLRQLLTDGQLAQIYDAGQLRHTSVAGVAREALERLD